MNFLKNKIENYRLKHEKKRRAMEAYYNKLLKASLIVSVVPIIVLIILVLYNRLSFIEGLASCIAVFFSSMFFAKPYLDDLSALTVYVDGLAIGKISQAPNLSFLNNVEQLSNSVLNLQKRWRERTFELESALAEARILFDTIPDILLMVDKNLNVVRANNAAINVFRRSIAVMNLNDISEGNNLVNFTNNVLEGATGENIEITLKTHHNFEDFLVMAERFPFQSSAGIAAVVIMHNITEEKRRKQLLKDFVANASHEIRTPLTSVMGFLENLVTLDEEEKDVNIRRKTRKKFFAIMKDQTNRMSKLVNDLLSLSKAEMNDTLTSYESVDIESVVRDSFARLEHTTKEKNIKIKFKEFKNFPMILGVYDELYQVFTNIISNAIKYGKENSKIEISKIVVSDFTRSVQMPKDCSELLLISIKDEGEGISEEHLPRITERFYRVDKVRAKKVGGTGLGLAITKHILYKHKGDLVIESKLGVGSTFTVRLPVAKE
jgi:two-component system phosphate regulon sensor histidine kinase PhoR